MTTFICIGGKAGSGKDHCAAVLTRYLKEQGKTFYVTAFADHLKQQCANVTGVPLHYWHIPEIKTIVRTDLRVVLCNDKGFKSWCVDNSHSIDVARSMRWVMQTYSDYQKSLHGADCYVKYTMDNIVEQLEEHSFDFVILTDTRYEAELDNTNILSYQPYVDAGFISVYIDNPDNITCLGSNKPEWLHTSEQLTADDFEHVILNSYGTRDEAILEQWKDIINV